MLWIPCKALQKGEYLQGTLLSPDGLPDFAFLLLECGANFSLHCTSCWENKHFIMKAKHFQLTFLMNFKGSWVIQLLRKFAHNG